MHSSKLFWTFHCRTLAPLYCTAEVPQPTSTQKQQSRNSAVEVPQQNKETGNKEITMSSKIMI